MSSIDNADIRHFRESHTRLVEDVRSGVAAPGRIQENSELRGQFRYWGRVEDRVKPALYSTLFSVPQAQKFGRPSRIHFGGGL